MIWNQQNCNDTSRCKPFFGWWRRCIITKRGRFTKSIWYLWLHAKNGSYLRCLVAFHRLFIACERKSYCIQSQLCKLSVVLKHSANVYAFQYTFNTFFKWLSELQRYDYFRANILKFEMIVYCYNIIPVKNIMTEYINREFHVESMFQVAHLIEWASKTPRTAREINDSLWAWSKFRSKSVGETLILIASIFHFYF